MGLRSQGGGVVKDYELHREDRSFLPGHEPRFGYSIVGSTAEQLLESAERALEWCGRHANSTPEDRATIKQIIADLREEIRMCDAHEGAPTALKGEAKS